MFRRDVNAPAKPTNIIRRTATYRALRLELKSANTPEKTNPAAYGKSQRGPLAPASRTEPNQKKNRGKRLRLRGTQEITQTACR